MTKRRQPLMDIRQILHHLRQGSSYRQTGLALGMDWRTVKKYHRWAEAHNLLEGELLCVEALQKLLERTRDSAKGLSLCGRSR